MIRVESVTKHYPFTTIVLGNTLVVLIGFMLEWLQLAVTTAIWLAAPLAVGLWTLRRSEVK